MVLTKEQKITLLKELAEQGHIKTRSGMLRAISLLGLKYNNINYKNI